MQHSTFAVCVEHLNTTRQMFTLGELDVWGSSADRTSDTARLFGTFVRPAAGWGVSACFGGISGEFDRALCCSSAVAAVSAVAALACGFSTLWVDSWLSLIHI